MGRRNLAHEWARQRRALAKALSRAKKFHLMAVACELLRCKMLDKPMPTYLQIEEWSDIPLGSIPRQVDAIRRLPDICAAVMPTPRPGKPAG
jgi:hypothetical protein